MVHVGLARVALLAAVMRTGEAIRLFQRREVVLRPELSHLGFQFGEELLDSEFGLWSDWLGRHEDNSIVENIWAANHAAIVAFDSRPGMGRC